MTLPLLLAAATEHAAGVAGIPERFGLEPKYIVMQVISFLIVLFVLYKFGIKPVTATMEERNRKISDGIRHAEEKKANVEATRIVDEARKSAKDFLDKQIQEASTKSTELLAKAQQAIELEHKKMLADARTEIARLVVITTERVLAKKLTDIDRAAYNDTAARELSNV
jgi:F-type H+-transporting ATPase subunit b